MALDQQMNCFEWQNRSSDYLDGVLSESLKREADEHLENCSECNERNKRYRQILSSIAGQPRVAPPPSLKKAPFSAAIPRDTALLSLTQWERIPWYLRTILEGTAIVVLILGGITSAPKIRALYERKI